jgi:hypothetical protein
MKTSRCPVAFDYDGFTDGNNNSDFNPLELLNLKAQINFDCECQQFDWLERMQFWDSMRTWFLARGYTLYDYEYSRNDEGQIEDIAYVYPATASEGDIRYPYSFFGGDPPNSIDRPLSGHALVDIFTCNPLSFLIPTLQPRIIFAQDSHGRHVAIKLVKDGSQEHRIYQFLHQDLIHDSLDNFTGILPPLDFFPLGNHWFIVMPRYFIRPLQCHY